MNGGATGRIIHLEDNDTDAELIQSMLESAGFHFEIVRAQSREEFEAALDRETVDLVLSDFSIPAYDGVRALRLTRDKKPALPFILVSGTIGEEMAIETLTSGATDYVLKEKLERLGPAIRRALDEAAERRQRRKAEEALAEERELMKAVLDHVQSGIVACDAKGVINLLNRTAQLRRNHPLGSLTLEQYAASERFLQPDGVTPVALEDLPLGKALRGETVSNLEIIAKDSQGLRRTMLVSGQAIHDQEGRNLGAVVAMHDITERIQKENRIRDQAELLDKAQDAILVKDPDDRITYWNRGAERLYGWTAEETAGISADDLLYGGQTLQRDAAMARLLRDGEWSGELNHVTKSGKQIIVMSRWSLMRGEAGNSAGVLSINTDITEKKQLEAQFLRAQRLESIGTLAGGIAHDLNNILAPIMMAAELLRAKLLSPDESKLLSAIEASSQRGADMVTQILSFARGVEGGKTEVQLNTILMEQVKIARGTFPRGIRVEAKTQRDLWKVMGGATQLYQVLMNLCVNARDAMPQGGVLRVESANQRVDERSARLHIDARPGPYVVLTVEDTGTGIPPQLLDRIFDPFFTTKEVGKGTGLGLSTVLGIVRSHGGFLTVESECGQGTRFKVYLPAVPDGSGKADGPEKLSAPTGAGQLVLVVDDELLIREIMTETLEGSGYRVLTAHNGAEALEIYAARRAEISLVVTDLAMPVMDGGTAIPALQKLNPDIKLVATSGMSEQGKIAELGPESQLAFLQKPFTCEKLLETIHKALRDGAA